MGSSAPLQVIHVATTAAHARAYEEVARLTWDARVSFVTQPPGTVLQPLLDTLLASIATRRVFFLVDDIVFTEPVDLALLGRMATPACVPSLRLGRNLSWSYTTAKVQPLPRFREVTVSGSAGARTRLLAWRWIAGELDWGYPLSLDGNIFQTNEIRGLMKGIAYTSPNTLEAELQRYRRLFSLRWGVCFPKSRLVNLPINRVQSDVPNIHGDIHQDDLLALWETGVMMDTSRLEGWET